MTIRTNFFPHGFDALMFGKDGNSQSGFFLGNVYESVYVSNSGLTPAQRLQVQRQVAAAAGITL